MILRSLCIVALFVATAKTTPSQTTTRPIIPTTTTIAITTTTKLTTATTRPISTTTRPTITEPTATATTTAPRLTTAEPKTVSTTATTSRPIITTVTPTTKWRAIIRPIISTTSSSPICEPKASCSGYIANVCGRDRQGYCRRFQNICQFQRRNCKGGRPISAWSWVETQKCRNLHVGETNTCSIQPPRRSRRKNRIFSYCVRSTNEKYCRLVANDRTLRNLNFDTRHRGFWSKTQMFRCRNMRVGELPLKCRSGRIAY